MPSWSSTTSSRLTLHDDETGPAKSWRPSIPNTLMFDESFGGYSGLLENVLDAVRGLAPLAATGRGRRRGGRAHRGDPALDRHAAREIDLSSRRARCHEDQEARDVSRQCRAAELPVRAADHRHRPDRRRRGDARMAGEGGRGAAQRMGRLAHHRQGSVRHRGRRRRHDPRPVPGRLHGDDRDLGVEIAMWDIIGKVDRPAGLPPDRRPGQARAARLCQRLVRRLRAAAGFRRRAREVAGARLPRDEVRPVRHRLEVAQPGAGEARARRRRRGRRGGRP